MVATLDTHLAAAIELDLTQRGLTPADIARGYSELGKLRRTEEPDYNARGVAVAYAFSYFTQRALSVALAVSQFDELPNPLRVLDIGSGTGAASVGLGLALPGWTIHVVAVEPAAEMREQAAVYAGHFVTSQEAHAGTLEDVLDREILTTEEAFDLVILSAALGYGDGRKFSRLEVTKRGLALQRRFSPSGRVLVIEPNSKTRQLDYMQSVLAVIPLRIRPMNSRQITGFALQLEMTKLTTRISRLHAYIAASGELSARGSRLLGPPWRIESWAKSPDYYLFAESGFRRRNTPRPSFSPATMGRPRTSQEGCDGERHPRRALIVAPARRRDWLFFGLAIVAGVAGASWLVSRAL